MHLLMKGTAIKHRLTFNGHTRNIVIPKKESKDPKYLHSLHNAIHKFLEDGKRESAKYIAAGKNMYCTRKQHEKIISIKK